VIRAILVAALLVLALRVGWVFSSPLVKNTMLEAKMEDLAKYRGLKSRADVMAEIRGFVEEKDIPLPAENLYVQVNDRETLIAAYYTTEARFWVLHYDYEFSPASSPNALHQLDLELARARFSAH
jgi:hypothetical protein